MDLIAWYNKLTWLLQVTAWTDTQKMLFTSLLTISRNLYKPAGLVLTATCTECVPQGVL